MMPEKEINVNSTLPASNPLSYARNWGREERRLLYSLGKPYQDDRCVFVFNLCWNNWYFSRPIPKLQRLCQMIARKIKSGKIFHASIFKRWVAFKHFYQNKIFNFLFLTGVSKNNCFVVCKCNPTL